eukprot:TRINITY_DN2245_c0_g1_i1.p1 TRINITY_DN2245_c0_g1~~TRINITY_DN2245_c0_g1_i1.p1  ORF type:complete len:226 (+),score=60.01 TRINITY_DN2245_c0_g1_i1:69-680(+)
MSGKFDALFGQVYDELEGIGGEVEFMTEALTFLSKRSPGFFASPNCMKQVLKVAKKIHTDALDKKQAEETMEVLETPSVVSERKEDTPSTPVSTIPTEGAPAQPQADEDETEEDRYKNAPVGNGGTTEHYVWTQTLSELTMIFEVPQNLRARDMNIDIRPQHLKVGIKGQPLLVNVGHRLSLASFCYLFDLLLLGRSSSSYYL